MNWLTNGVAGVVVAASVMLPASAHAQPTESLAGVWTFNRSLSTVPPEIGFNVAWLPSTSGGDAGTPPAGGGGRGRRGGGGAPGGRGGSGFFAPRESYEDSQRVSLLTTEARKPPVRLMIVDTPGAVTITNDLGQSRALHPDGKQDSVEFQGVLFPVTTRRDGDRLIAVYHVQRDRDVRYTYSRSATPLQLIVDVEFIDHSEVGDKERCVYEPGVATDTSAAPSPAPSTPGSAARGTASQPASVPAQPSPEGFDERPGAEFKGIKAIGILVEELSQQAISCGLNHDALESALARRLTSGGFDVRKNSDEDTYVYVNVMTATQSTGTCVSRYDVFLYTHGTAKLSYTERPVLVQVSLMHRGGIGTSAPSAHAAAVTHGLENYIDLVMTQIHDANK